MYRNGIIQDSTGHIRITVWRQPVISMINEGEFYNLTDMNTKIWDNNLRVETTRSTVVERIDDANKQEEAKTLESPDLTLYHDDDKNIETLNNPNITSVEITEGLICQNTQCQAPLLPEQNQKFVRCSNCNRKQVVEKLSKSVNGVVDVENDATAVTLNFDADIINGLFGIQFSSSTTEEIEEKLLLLEGVVITYDKKSKKITSIIQKMSYST